MKPKSIRYRIANWISGGELERSDAVCEIVNRYYADAVEVVREKNARLDRIAEQETPGANATVRRMAKIAKGEM